MYPFWDGLVLLRTAASRLAEKGCRINSRREQRHEGLVIAIALICIYRGGIEDAKQCETESRKRELATSFPKRL